MKDVANGTVVHDRGKSSQQARIEAIMESFCGDGCKEVWAVISRLESGQVLPQTEGLTAQELEELLTELKSVMAVYSGTCGA